MKIFAKEVKRYHIAETTAQDWIANGEILHDNGNTITVRTQDGNVIGICRDVDANFVPGIWFRVEE